MHDIKFLRDTPKIFDKKMNHSHVDLRSENILKIDKKNENRTLKLHLILVSIILSLMIVFRPPNIIFSIIYFILII